MSYRFARSYMNYFGSWKISQRRWGAGRDGGGGVGEKKPVIYKSLAIYETKYSRIDQVKYVEYSL